MTQNTVLVLGAGLVTGPLVEYLANNNVKVLVASRTLSRAEALCNGLENASAVQLDISDPKGIAAADELIPTVDAVISMLPYVFHPVAAKIAIKHKKHFLTTSYVSDKMKELHDSAVEAGVCLINECGLDPGTDHMSAMRVIDEVKNRKGKIVSFTSICGGLPAPANNNNPYGYKFSWAPRGVLLASRNVATFLRDGEELHWESDKIFAGDNTTSIDGIDLELEIYPNRNSVPYRDIYDIPEAATLMRGTFRYKNWSLTIKSIIQLGLLDLEENSLGEATTYAELINAKLAAAGHKSTSSNVAENVASFLQLPADHFAIKNLEWLGLFSDQKINAKTALDSVCDLMLSKETMQYKEGELDMVVMQHKYVASFPDGSKENISTTLVTYGLPNSFSAMARTVSYPVAIATRLVLEGKVAERGVIRPISPELYNPILDEMDSKFNIQYVDKYEKC